MQKLLQALDVNSTKHYPLLWWALISFCSAWDLPASLIASVDTTKARESLDSDRQEERLLIDPSGCSIIAALLKYSKEFISPLIQVLLLSNGLVIIVAFLSRRLNPLQHPIIRSVFLL